MSEASLDAIVMIDSSDTVLFWNHAAEEMFGYARDEALGQRMHDIVSPLRYHGQVRAGLKDFASTGRGSVVGTTQEMTAHRRDGKEFPVERTVAAFEMNGQWFAVGGIRDISRRKEAEEVLLRTNQELEEKQHVLDADLAAAAEIQKSLLPQQIPPGDRIEIDWRFQPSQSIGGDIFNILVLDQDRLGIYILDVSGHGVPAALVAVARVPDAQAVPGSAHRQRFPCRARRWKSTSRTAC